MYLSGYTRRELSSIGYCVDGQLHTQGMQKCLGVKSLTGGAREAQLAALRYRTQALFG